MIKLWEKSSIAKVALKRGVQLTTSERMAEEIKVIYHVLPVQLINFVELFLQFHFLKQSLHCSCILGMPFTKA